MGIGRYQSGTRPLPDRPEECREGWMYSGSLWICSAGKAATGFGWRPVVRGGLVQDAVLTRGGRSAADSRVECRDSITTCYFFTNSNSPSRAATLIRSPGSIYVAAAKKLLAGDVGIDFVAGPTEILIICADGNPRHLAADMLAQAEHDVDAAAILLTTSERLANAV